MENKKAPLTLKEAYDTILMCYTDGMREEDFIPFKKEFARCLIIIYYSPEEFYNPVLQKEHMDFKRLILEMLPEISQCAY